ncbi:MAG: glutathione synthase/RimK-type ligase-like ATP-grasp enzyme [Desulforhopalus sp.]|jgi:glutathione synthase/RimK-type ligase-like ATP-grasp enzyme
MKQDIVLVAGLPNDPCVASVVVALERQGIAYVLWNQRDLLNDCAYLLQHGNLDGVIMVGDNLIELNSITGVFNRVSELELTPEYRSVDAKDPIARHAIAANWILSQWFELAPVPVLNRGTTNESNSTKAFQTQLIRRYLPVPDTLVTNDVEQARAFWKEHGRVIYKSCSGERSIVTELDEETLATRASNLALCPVLFQQYIEGTDIRVHVVGSEIFATAIVSKTTDYRYDSDTTWSAVDFSGKYASACIALSQALGLELAGIDLRITPSGDIYCFEVNPSPAFSVYENATGQPIANAIAKYLK